MSVLVINTGSSSLKFGLFDTSADQPLTTGLIDWTGNAQPELVIKLSDGRETRRRVDVSGHGTAADIAIRAFAENTASLAPVPDITAVGHRVVHGGTAFREAVLIDDRVIAEIARLAELAPLHNPPALEAIQAAGAALPGRPQVAVFDTSFYSQLPPAAVVYPLPYEWFERWGIRRFGFHGISHAYCAGRAASMLGRNDSRLVICHLGNGCSATAVAAGAPVATTMGFTPMEGLMMGTRAGSIDPGILLYLQKSRRLSAEQIDDALNHQSGLLGVSGISSDFRQVEAAALANHDRARLALDMYADRIRSAVGALSVTMGGLDALVFTAGVGEHSAHLRAEVCRGLEFLGLRLDLERNAACRPDSDIAAADSPGRILVIRTCEELMIAREVSRLTRLPPALQ